MKNLLTSALVILAAISNAQTISNLDGRNLIAFQGDSNIYFPNTIGQNLGPEAQNGPFYSMSFNSKHYSQVLKMLGERSLSDKYHGKDVVRLTKIEHNYSQFTIRIEKSGRAIVLSDKESRREYLTTEIDTVNNFYKHEQLKFDSARDRYEIVSYDHHLRYGFTDSAIEVGRKQIDPIDNRKTEELTIAEWNNLVRLIESNSFLEMPAIEGAFEFHGYHVLIEIHSKKGYYMVDRYVPEDGDFKDILDQILLLAKRRFDY